MDCDALGLGLGLEDGDSLGLDVMDGDGLADGGLVGLGLGEGEMLGLGRGAVRQLRPEKPEKQVQMLGAGMQEIGRAHV